MSIRDFEDFSPQIDPSAYIDPQATVIGAVSIGAEASLWPQVVARGDINKIHIGARTNIQDGSILHVTHAGPFTGDGAPLLIDEDVTVGHQATLHACHVQHHCLVGMGAVILDKAVLEPYTMLAAGSLVSPGKVLEGKFLWRGSPAKKARPLTDRELEFLDYSAQNYVRLAKRYLQI